LFTNRHGVNVAEDFTDAAVTMLEIKQLCSDAISTDKHGEVPSWNRRLATHYPTGFFLFSFSYSIKSPEYIRLGHGHFLPHLL